MAVGIKKTTDHISGFKQEITAVSKSDRDAFFNWFDESGGDTDTNYLKGQCEFVLYILMPVLYALKDIKNKTALEIGYGGGRLLSAACYFFKEVIGIDIHNNAPIVKAELHKRHINNFKLFQNDGKSIPVKNASIDFVYSFIVLQHVEKIDIFNNYIKETYNVLKKGGVAILFFGRLYQKSSNTQSKALYAMDKILEKFHPTGYIQVFTRVNCTNLKVSLDYARKKSVQEGFTILKEGVSRKLPDMVRYGGQYYVMLKK